MVEVYLQLPLAQPQVKRQILKEIFADIEHRMQDLQLEPGEFLLNLRVSFQMFRNCSFVYMIQLFLANLLVLVVGVPSVLILPFKFNLNSR